MHYVQELLLTRIATRLLSEEENTSLICKSIFLFAKNQFIFILIGMEKASIFGQNYSVNMRASKSNY